MAAMKGKRKRGLSQDESVLSQLPRDLNIVEFANSRLKEIETLAKVVKNTSENKNAYQDLPRHMRRRAASHNVKRLPRRVRQRAQNAHASAAPTKRPSRKHRRRPRNLVSDYARRQRKHVWLETHLWHAKRFHMKEQWGYKLPEHPNDKSIRASYRATAHHCLMQDMSYMCCVEVSGPKSTIIEGMGHLVHPDTGPTVGSVAFLSGAREGRMFLYSGGRYPFGALGPAQFTWRPELSESTQHCLWLWVHPSIHEHVVAEIKQVFQLTEDQAENTPKSDMDITASPVSGKPVSPANAKTTQPSKAVEVDPRTQVIPCPTFSSDLVKVTLLKDTLCRFRLTGPQSHAVLQAALHVADVSSAPQSKDEASAPWWQAHYSNTTCMASCQKQAQAWQEMSCLGSPAEVTSHVVLALTVRDPRLFLPRKKVIKPQDMEQESSSRDFEWHKRWTPELCLSPIWEENIRSIVKTTKQPDHEMNKLRSAHLVPGQPLNLGLAESRIPVLLLQQPGRQSVSGRSMPAAQPACPQGYAAGWDIILPSGWGSSFWVSLVYRGARPGGLREDLALCAEAGRLHFPTHYPDTTAGQQWEKADAQERQDKFNRMPPAKRRNYIKLGTAAPFHSPWSKLLEEWREGGESDRAEPMQVEPSGNHNEEKAVSVISPSCTFTVLRDQSKLRVLNSLCMPQSSTSNKDDSLSQAFCTDSANSLIPVYVKMVQRGTPELSAMICLPTSEDMQLLAEDSHAAGPLEPLHKQPREEKESAEKAVQAIPVRASCSRDICGLLKHGGYSLSNGQGSGMGFVTLNGLLQVLKQKPVTGVATVLVRSAQSLQYRYAYVTVMTEV